MRIFIVLFTIIPLCMLIIHCNQFPDQLVGVKDQPGSNTSMVEHYFVPVSNTDLEPLSFFQIQLNGDSWYFAGYKLGQKVREVYGTDFPEKYLRMLYIMQRSFPYPPQGEWADNDVNPHITPFDAVTRAQAIKEQIPEDFINEMKGFADAIDNITNGGMITYEHVLMASLYMDIFTVATCTAIGTFGDATVDGTPIIGRNLDMATAGFLHTLLCTYLYKVGPVEYIATGFVGVFSTLNGMNNGGLALEVIPYLTKKGYDSVPIYEQSNLSAMGFSVRDALRSIAKVGKIDETYGSYEYFKGKNVTRSFHVLMADPVETLFLELNPLQCWAIKQADDPIVLYGPYQYKSFFDENEVPFATPMLELDNLPNRIFRTNHPVYTLYHLEDGVNPSEARCEQLLVEEDWTDYVHQYLHTYPISTGSATRFERLYSRMKELSYETGYDAAKLVTLLGDQTDKKDFPVYVPLQLNLRYYAERNFPTTIASYIWKPSEQKGYIFQARGNQTDSENIGPANLTLDDYIPVDFTYTFLK